MALKFIKEFFGIRSNALMQMLIESEDKKFSKFIVKKAL